MLEEILAKKKSGEKHIATSYDIPRTIRMAAVGMFLSGPLLHVWYVIPSITHILTITFLTPLTLFRSCALPLHFHLRHVYESFLLGTRCLTSGLPVLQQKLCCSSMFSFLYTCKCLHSFRKIAADQLLYTPLSLAGMNTPPLSCNYINIQNRLFGGSAITGGETAIRD